MSLEIPFKLLEINVISAQDLPPVSKMLRTFAVAWINPDHKLSTRIDHQGHTNPTWNYKLVFRVEDRFLRSEAAAVTIEVYNVAWLRDLPIGTAQLMINQISPSLTHNSPAMRNVALHIRRPSRHLQGILNVGINILDNGNPDLSPPSVLSMSQVGNHEPLENGASVEDKGVKVEAKIGQKDSEGEKQSSIDEKMMLYDEEFNEAKPESSILDSTIFDNPSSELEVIRPTALPSIGSAASAMKPLPSEVAANLKKGLYSTAGDDYGSSIFDNWTEAPNDSSDCFRSRSIRWRMDDQTPILTKDHEGKKESKKDRPQRRRHSDGGGLFSCFGKGFEFTFICGSSNMNRNRKKMHRQPKYHYGYPDDDLGRFYT